MIRPKDICMYQIYLIFQNNDVDRERRMLPSVQGKFKKEVIKLLIEGTMDIVIIEVVRNVLEYEIESCGTTALGECLDLERYLKDMMKAESCDRHLFGEVREPHSTEPKEKTFSVRIELYSFDLNYGKLAGTFVKEKLETEKCSISKASENSVTKMMCSYFIPVALSSYPVKMQVAFLI